MASNYTNTTQPRPTPHQSSFPGTQYYKNSTVTFSGSPRLVARTDPDRWTKTFYAYGCSQTLVQDEKYYMALENPEIIGKWCKDLSISIIEALYKCEWAYFFPIRTCPRDDQRLQKSAAATILLVAVKPASLE